MGRKERVYTLLLISMIIFAMGRDGTTRIRFRIKVSIRILPNQSRQRRPEWTDLNDNLKKAILIITL